MKRTIDRRGFMQRCALSSAGVLVGSLFPRLLRAELSDSAMTLCSVTGDRIFDNTMAAVDALGGMKRFVRKDASVALLINSVFDRPGTYVNADIPLAIVKMCFDAGAKSVVTIEDTPNSYWRRASKAGKLSAEISRIGRTDKKQDIPIAKGRSLKEGSVSSALLSCDVFINVPVIKDHQGTRYTGNLKNMMGAFSSATCRRCHFGDQAFLKQLFQDYYSKMELLSQSIADLNLVRPPDLSVADVTEVLATHGPSGPGRIVRPMQVVAGNNAVAVDMYSVQHLTLNPNDLLVIKFAQEHSLGPKSLAEVKIIEK